MRVNKYFTYVYKHVNPYTHPGAGEPRGDPSRGGEHAGSHAQTAPRLTDPTLGRTRVPGPCASSKFTALLPSLLHTVPSHTLAKGRRGKLGREGREGPAGPAPMPSASGQEEAAHGARPGRGGFVPPDWRAGRGVSLGGEPEALQLPWTRTPAQVQRVGRERAWPAGWHVQ